ncbi:MAG TPA: PilC/PilY family type IV pilus protein, partial [Thermoanaerobaculia bacterium]|nr:PilC/PilY family type IV pilus protein [Thermoanaerobaculia bacterium]
GSSPTLSDDDSLVPVKRGEAPAFRALLQVPAINFVDATVAEWDLWRGLGYSFSPGPGFTFGEGVARVATRSVLNTTYTPKTGPADVDLDGDGTAPDQYVLGDVFHSDPVIVGAPSNIRYFASNLNGYREFARQQENRRKVLLVGSNDGMLHAFDAGQPRLEQIASGVEDVEFDNGTGKELFAYVPRAMLPEIRDRAANLGHDWGVDGSVNVADVHIDPVFQTVPDEDDREWRTVLIGGFRRGAPGYYALDLTQPDPVEHEQVGSPARTIFMPDENAPLVPECANTTGNVESPRPATATEVPCHDELTYPAPLWEFSDRVWVADLGRFVRLDEERDDDDPEDLEPNGHADLGNSWSVPNLGRIRLCNGSNCVPSVDADQPDDLEDRYVAIFGGGLPADKNRWGQVGNWLYMVDIETGETIYKRELVDENGNSAGSAAAEPAAVDTNNDGYLDRIYIGTTGGFLFRVDLEEYQLSGGNRVLRPFPNLETQVVAEVPDPSDGSTIVLTARRVPFAYDDGAPLWQPRVIFDTLAPRSLADPTLVRRPLFLRPSVLFVAELGQYAVNFGTGDREDLWRTDPTAARFYTFVDDSDPIDPTTFPFVESDLRPVDLDGVNVDFNDPTVTERNFLLDRDPGQRGWVLRLDPRERLIAAPFNLSGVTFFVTFTPRFFAESGECSREGDSRLFAVNTTNANGFLRDEFGARTRYSLQGLSFATAPFTEQAQTKNQQSGESEEESADTLTPDLLEIMSELQALFPDNCEFGNYRIDVKTVLDRTEVEFIAPVPVCIIERNWKEFDR